MDDPTPIRRCICGGYSFAALKALGITDVAQAERLGCGINCRYCRPYILKMILTGQTAFSLEDGLSDT